MNNEYWCLNCWDKFHTKIPMQIKIHDELMDGVCGCGYECWNYPVTIYNTRPEFTKDVK